MRKFHYFIEFYRRSPSIIKMFKNNTLFIEYVENYYSSGIYAIDTPDGNFYFEDHEGKFLICEICK